MIRHVIEISIFESRLWELHDKRYYTTICPKYLSSTGECSEKNEDKVSEMGFFNVVRYIYRLIMVHTSLFLLEDDIDVEEQEASIFQ